LDEQVGLSPDLALDRSEIVNVIVKAFFKAGLDLRARARELVIMNRNGHLQFESVHDCTIQRSNHFQPSRDELFIAFISDKT